jgi:hypothetical protein
MKVHVGLREERLEGHRLARRIALLFPLPAGGAGQEIEQAGVRHIRPASLKNPTMTCARSSRAD